MRVADVSSEVGARARWRGGGVGVAREAASRASVSRDSGENREKGSSIGSVEAAAIRSSGPRGGSGEAAFSTSRRRHRASMARDAAPSYIRASVMLPAAAADAIVTPRDRG